MNPVSPDNFTDLSLFAQGTDAVWIEDLSAVKGFIESKRSDGVKDFYRFFNEHPEELIKCRRMTHIVDANREFLQFFGIPGIDAIHTNIFSFFPLETLPAYWEELVNLSEGSVDNKAKISVKTATGCKKEVEIQSTFLPGYEKSIAHVLFTCTDITDEIRNENDLCDSWENINRFIRCVNVPIFAWNLDMKIILFNGAIVQLTGIPKNEAIMSDITILFPDKYKKSTFKLFKRATAGERLELMMIPVNQRSGDTRTILWNTARITNSKGAIVGTIAQGIDVTEQRWAKDYMNKYISELIEKNNELERTKHQLEEINQTLDDKVLNRSKDIEELLKQKEEFITQIGHDLKTPLTPLLAILPVIRKKEQDPKQLEYLDIAIRNASHVHDILINIIKIARLNKGYRPSPGTFLLIHQMIEEIVINFEHEILIKRITVNNCVPTELRIRISPIDFDTIFDNLLDNAIKYSNFGCTITIEGEITETGIVIRFRDTGIGLLPTQKNKIFEKFYKGDYSRHNGKSYGLGLSITQQIIEKNGGTIKVESKGVDMGSTFIITFPLEGK
jgi:PAS domain S-box-containing protein